MEACQVQGFVQNPSALALYLEPGIGRIIELDMSDIPPLSAVMRPVPEKRQFTVTRKKGDWVRIVYDDAGREGWFLLPRQWRFQSWDRYLRGREVRPVAGVRKESLQLYSAPSGGATVLETMERERSLRVLDVYDGWILVLVDMSRSGWLRWKDDDGRFLVSVE